MLEQTKHLTFHITYKYHFSILEPIISKKIIQIIKCSQFINLISKNKILKL